MLYLCYPRCITCQKAKKWLTEQGLSYTERNIKEENPSVDELRAWSEKSGQPLSKFFNTSGQLYRSMNLKDRLPTMTDEEKLNLLAADGMLVKRPLLVTEDKVLIGFSAARWSEALF